MLKLLIVDDEEIICKTIAELTDWSSLNIELIGTCLDGVDAYHMILDECPDIVMTDINMPGISGLELIERINRTVLDTQFIILSGYAEFEYAKRAMKFGIKHYLLKPCDEEQICSTIQEVVQECLQIKKEKESSAITIQNFLIQRVMIQNLIREGVNLSTLNKNLFESSAPYLNLYTQIYQCCTLYYLERSCLKEAMEKIHDYLNLKTTDFPFHAIYTANVLQLFFPDFSENYYWLDSFMEKLNFPDQQVGIKYERKSYTNLEQFLSMLIPKLKHYDVFYFVNEDHLISNFNYDQIISDVAFLSDALMNRSLTDNDSTFVTTTMGKLHQILLTVNNKDFLLQLAAKLLVSLSINAVSGDIMDVAQTLSKLHTKSNLTEIRDGIMEEVFRIINAHISSPYSPFIQRILDYVEEHISEESMTLKGISETVLYMNASYVSRIFVKEVGQTFTSYVTEHRVQKAKKILSGNDTAQIQSVATLVGCGNNPYYFSKIFKKVTGMTPSIYVRRYGTGFSK